MTKIVCRGFRPILQIIPLIVIVEQGCNRGAPRSHGATEPRSNKTRASSQIHLLSWFRLVRVR